MMKETRVKYAKLIIYYFSGTGNARNAAGWIREVAEENGIEAYVVNIDKLEKIDLNDFSGNCLIGICSPTHGFNLPPITLNFIRKLPRVKNVDAFILNTRAGMKLHKLFLPGISGFAQLLPALMLRLKGFRIVGMQPLDLPSNWLILHPGLKTKVVISIYHRCKRIVRHFSSKLLSGQPGYKALRSLPVDIAFLPLTFGYYIFGRFFLAKTLVATDECNNCEKMNNTRSRYCVYCGHNFSAIRKRFQITKTKFVAYVSFALIAIGIIFVIIDFVRMFIFTVFSYRLIYVGLVAVLSGLVLGMISLKRSKS